MPSWPIRVVSSDGDLGKSIGTITRKDDGSVTVKGTFARELLDTVVRRADVDESQAVDLLVRQGWSNGYLALDLS